MLLAEQDSPEVIHDKRHRLATALTAFMPAASVLTSAEDLRPYECDGLSVYRALPMIAALPTTVDDVKRVMHLATQVNAKVVARGAGTGLSGGATPLVDGVLLSLAKFNRVTSIDPLARTAVVEPGVRNLKISEAVAHLNLYYAPDPSSQIACSDRKSVV